jgi:hypothetical protein
MRVLVSGTTRWQPLLAALVLGLSIFAAAAAEFTSPTLGTSLNEPSDLEIQNVQLLNQLPLPDGRVLLEASATVSNRAEGLWSGVTVGYRVSIDLGPYQVLASNSTLVATGGMHLLVSTASLTSARDELLSGAPLVLYGTDQNGQRVANPTNDLALINHRVLGELAVSANKTLLVFAADVQNLGSNRWTHLSIGLDAALATNEFSVAASAATFPATLPPIWAACRTRRRFTPPWPATTSRPPCPTSSAARRSPARASSCSSSTRRPGELMPTPKTPGCRRPARCWA